jgi:nucleotide-binding universal stress UspA family protein
MKVIVGIDGSRCSATAVELLSTLEWPEETRMRLVGVFDTFHLVGPWAPYGGFDVSDVVDDLTGELRGALADARSRLGTGGIELESVVMEGRPASALADAAEEWGADLVVVGSRGLGALRTMLLGSVSAEVVDNVRCPVLVVRRPTIRSVLLAHDGSDLAKAAEDILAGWPPFRDLPVEVLSIVRGDGPWAETLSPVAQGRAAVAVRESIEASRQHHEDVGRAAADRLGLSGRVARAEVRAGDPARTLVDEAEARDLDLIAMGTHGRTGLERLRMGSVARNVLTHAHCSVLIVPPPDRDR